MKKKILILGAALALALALAACGGKGAVKPSDPPTPQETDAQETQSAPAWALDPDTVTDDFLVDTVIRLPELALSDGGFTFESPRDLTAWQLYLLFLAWSEPATLDACYDTENSIYVFDADTICQTLDRYLEGYSLVLADCPLYDAGRNAVVTQMAGGFGGNLDVQLESRTFDGNTGILTAVLDGSVRKTYTVAFYDGGYRYLSAEQLSPARAAVGTMTLNGEPKEVFAAVTDEELCLWNAASGGQLLAAARFPAALPGARDGLKSCDFSDLDGDGNSELTAEFSFADGSSASLVWFYTDSGLVYNDEFSRLPGEQGVGNEGR